MKNLSDGFEKLKKNELTSKEYIQFRSQCLRIIRKLGIRYSLSSIVIKPIDVEDVIGKVYSESLIKTLKNHQKKKGKFTTFFYYKAISSLRVEMGKHKRRYRVLNTIPLKEEIYNKEKHDKRYRTID